MKDNSVIYYYDNKRKKTVVYQSPQESLETLSGINNPELIDYYANTITQPDSFVTGVTDMEEHWTDYSFYDNAETFDIKKLKKNYYITYYPGVENDSYYKNYTKWSLSPDPIETEPSDENKIVKSIYLREVKIRKAIIKKFNITVDSSLYGGLFDLGVLIRGGVLQIFGTVNDTMVDQFFFDQIADGIVDCCYYKEPD